MAANGISTLPTKEQRQKAKLDLAAADRAAVGNQRAAYDITQLPTQYSGNVVVDNPNDGGLIAGRPWVSDPSALINNILLENGNNLLLEDDKYIMLET